MGTRQHQAPAVELQWQITSKNVNDEHASDDDHVDDYDHHHENAHNCLPLHRSSITTATTIASMAPSTTITSAATTTTTTTSSKLCTITTTDTLLTTNTTTTAVIATQSPPIFPKPLQPRAHRCATSTRPIRRRRAFQDSGQPFASNVQLGVRPAALRQQPMGASWLGQSFCGKFKSVRADVGFDLRAYALIIWCTNACRLACIMLRHFNRRRGGAFLTGRGLATSCLLSGRGGRGYHLAS